MTFYEPMTESPTLLMITQDSGRRVPCHELTNNRWRDRHRMHASMSTYNPRGDQVDGLSVARDALLEVGRPDLCRELIPVDHSAIDSEWWGTPHLRDYTMISLRELALLEKAMRIGYAATDRSYECDACENMFNAAGIVHAGDLRVEAC
jgi:hypothetical protein